MGRAGHRAYSAEGGVEQKPAVVKGGEKLMSLDRVIKPSKAQAVELFASKLQQDISVGCIMLSQRP